MSLHCNDPLLAERMEKGVARVDSLAISAERLGRDLAMNALESVLLDCVRLNPRTDEHSLDPRLERAISFVIQGMRRKITLDDIAHSAGLSKPQIVRLFRNHMGITPARFVEQQRLDRARQMLAVTALPVQTIAWEVGFDNPFYFSLRFKKHLGLSPTEYRTKRMGLA